MRHLQMIRKPQEVNAQTPSWRTLTHLGAKFCSKCDLGQKKKNSIEVSILPLTSCYHSTEGFRWSTSSLNWRWRMFELQEIAVTPEDSKYTQHIPRMTHIHLFAPALWRWHTHTQKMVQLWYIWKYSREAAIDQTKKKKGPEKDYSSHHLAAKKIFCQEESKRGRFWYLTTAVGKQEHWQWLFVMLLNIMRPVSHHSRNVSC